MFWNNNSLFTLMNLKWEVVLQVLRNLLPAQDDNLPKDCTDHHRHYLVDADGSPGSMGDIQWSGSLQE
jgi:hypothetical protein